jgi:hypothetical protein
MSFLKTRVKHETREGESVRYSTFYIVLYLQIGLTERGKKVNTKVPFSNILLNNLPSGHITSHHIRLHCSLLSLHSLRKSFQCSSSEFRARSSRFEACTEITPASTTFSPAALIHMYVPMYTVYIHTYYIQEVIRATGLSLGLEWRDTEQKLILTPLSPFFSKKSQLAPCNNDTKAVEAKEGKKWLFWNIFQVKIVI